MSAELIDAYLNGPRTLSNDRLSYLVVSQPEVDPLLTPPRTPSPSGEDQPRLALDDVPGLGEVRRKTLLKHFGSLKKLREASPEDIAQVPGIGMRTAGAIKEAVIRESR